MRLLAACLLGLCGAVQAAAQGSCARDRVDLRGDWGRARFAVAVADDEQERARGLMYVDELARNRGMLFVYDAPRQASFWMRNTYIPLDMIFIGPDGRVIKVHENAVPLDETPIDGGDGVLAVLEINGGVADQFGIEAGSEVRHPAFAPGAVWPCEP